MSETEGWVELADVPSIADIRALNALEPSSNGTHPETNSWTPLNLADLDEKPPAEPTLGGLGIVYPGKRHIFSGPQESAKTLAAYAIGLEVVRHDGRLVLIDFEMGRWDARNRLRELGATPEELAMISYVEPFERARPADIAALIDLSPDLVLIDAAAGAFDLEGLDDNRRGDVERFAGIYVRAFWTNGIATIILDHVVKNTETRGAYAIGSERKVGGADVHIGFVTLEPIKRGGSGRYKITTHKDRGGFLKRGKLAEFELASDPDTHALTWTFQAAEEVDEDAPFRPTHLMEKVSRWLELQTEPVARSEVEKAKLGRAEYVRGALDLLTREGWIEETKGSNRARLVETINAYREADDTHSSGSSPVRPEFVPEPGITSSSVRPSPYGGGHGDEFVPKDAPGSSRASNDLDFE